MERDTYDIPELIELEKKRQQETINLIPSENFVSRAVLEALGSCLVNKYAEGYPGKRYYQGNEVIDEIENLTIERAKKLFNTPHANVQPYSGSPANQAVYMACCSLGDTVMGMDLSAGGHLTHGSAVSFSGKYYASVFYGVAEETQRLDYEEIAKIAEKEKPRLIWCGATAYPRFFDWSEFNKIARSVGAYLAADISHYAGLVAGGAYPSPVDWVDIVTTTTHKTLRGPRGAIILVTDQGLQKDPDLAKKIQKSVFPGLQGGPHENAIAAIAVCLAEASTDEFKEYAKQVVINSAVLAEELKKNGFNLVSGGTDNHLILIDLRNKNILGKEAAVALEKAGIICNANSIPFDPNPPARPSGIRLGTPAVTTRGMKEAEMKVIAGLINSALEKEADLSAAKNEVLRLISRFPLK